MKPVVVMDVDGVLADFEGDFCERFGTENREWTRLEQRYPQYKNNIVRYVNSSETYRLLQPLQIGLDIVRYLFNQQCIIHIVTSRPKGTHDITKDWLQYYNISYDYLSTSPDKIQFIKSIEPTLLVDDIISVADECHPIPAIIVAHPWNETVFYSRINTLADFIVSYKQIVERHADLSTNLRGT